MPDFLNTFSIDPLASSATADLEEGRRVLDIEIQGLQALAHLLNQDFVRAVDVMFQAQGRIVLTGVGKSGHIARKISSTLSSTGTPSFFIHPAEASHGDLGMLAKGDALLALSNSGETKELAEIITFAKANQIPLIGVTQNLNSTLAQTADITLALPKVKEACPLELAPTTSSLMTLALGDALSMALLKRRGFTPTDFSRLHPGGKLGSRLVRIEKIMHIHEALPLVQPQTSMKDVLLTMTSKSFGCVGVVDSKGCLQGIVTDGDLRRHMSPTLLEKTAHDIMTQSPQTLSPGILVEEAASIMNNKGITGAFVIDIHDKVIGFVHMHDCLKQGRIQ